MTDLQLAILLRQYHARLVGVVAELERQLPESMKEVCENKLIPQFGPSVSYPATNDLWAMANDLEASAAALEKANG